jgi:hypothetical protein
MMFERMDPKTLMKWLIVAALVYFVLPYDLFPDFLGLAGRIDDVLVMGWLAWIYRSQMRNYFEASSGSTPPGNSSGAGADRGPSTRANPTGAFDPFEILGVPRSASSDDIQAAYRARMMEYHPDKVAHLGAELQELAHEKAQQIERAYRQLRD